MFESWGTTSTQLRFGWNETMVNNKIRLNQHEFSVSFDHRINDIFSTGAELADVVRSRIPSGPLVFTVGVTDVVPKLIAAEVIH